MASSFYHFFAYGYIYLKRKGFYALILLFAFLGNAHAQKKQDADSLTLIKLVDVGNKLKTTLDKRSPNYLLQAVTIAEKYKGEFYRKQLKISLAGLGGYYTFKGMQDSAKIYYQKLLLFGETHNMQEAIAGANTGLGLIAYYQGDFDVAVQKTLLALKYAESVGDENGIASTSGNIANSYIRLKRYDRAIGMLETSIDLYNKLGLKIQAANSISNLARAYGGLGNTEKELEMKLKALSLFKQEHYKKGMATVSINLGVYYEKINKVKEAKRYYYEALQLSRETGDKGNIAILFNNMTDLYLKENKLDSAGLLCDSAWYYAQRSGDKISQYDALINKNNILRAQGKHKEAQEAFNHYTLLKDSVYNDKMLRQVADMDVKYQTAKKEAQIALINRENNIKDLQLKNNHLEIGRNKLLITQQQQELLINELEISNKDQLLRNQQLDAEKKAQNIKNLQKQSQIQDLEIANRGLALKQRNYAIIAIFIGFIAVGGFSFSYYNRQKLKQEARIQAEIHKQREIATKAVFDGEQQERIRIARDLHDSIGQMLSVVKMNVSALNTADNRTSKTLVLVDKTIDEVRNISHNLIPEELSFGLFNALEDLCEKINLARKTKILLNISDETRSKTSLNKQSELSVYRIIQEILSNMIKHSKASEIILDMKHTEYVLLMMIKDNGEGFDVENIEKSDGLGWKNIAARVHLLDGHLKVNSAPHSGTQIEITIPV